MPGASFRTFSLGSPVKGLRSLSPPIIKHLADVTPPGTKRLEVVCEQITSGLDVPGAPLQSIHLLVEDDVEPEEIRRYLSHAGIGEVEIRHVPPSPEDVFVTLTKKQSPDPALEKR
ncbi:MAG: hypothetical protein ACM3SR_07025 [Ignavibacteriales bacterium]